MPETWTLCCVRRANFGIFRAHLSSGASGRGHALLVPRSGGLMSPPIPIECLRGSRHDLGSLCDHRLRSALDRLWRLDDPGRSRRRPRHAAHAGDRRRHSGRRASLSRPPIHHDRHCRRRHLLHPGLSARHSAGDRLRHRRGAVGRGRLYRHECLGPRQCQDRASRDQEPGRGLEPRLPRRRHHRPAGRRPRSARRLGLFPHPHVLRRVQPRLARRGRCAGRARLRRLADLHLRPSRRRHLHQGRRCRRRYGRQGRGRHSRGRPAQPRHHRRQCRRQCRRLRRHGGRSVRDLCGDHGGHHGAGLDLFRRRRSRHADDALSARHRRHLRHHLDHRHLFRAARQEPVDHGRAL